MNVLVACEESQRVCMAFREKGHNAFSCDIIDCSGGHPEWHIKEDVLKILNPTTKYDWNEVIEFTTVDGTEHTIEGKWDLIIAHPPCTYLAVSGNRWFNVERYGDRARERIHQRELAVEFFMQFVNADCEHIAIENPIGHMSTAYRKPDQIIQPFWFGDPEKKSTCLWLKNLPLLTPTNMVEPNLIKLGDGKTFGKWHYETLPLPKEERQKLRSRTFPGFAKAMADQWGNL